MAWIRGLHFKFFNAPEINAIPLKHFRENGVYVKKGDHRNQGTHFLKVRIYLNAQAIEERHQRQAALKQDITHSLFLARITFLSEVINATRNVDFID